MAEQKNRLSKIEMLESAPHFAFLSFEDKKRLVSHMEVEEFLPGDPLIAEGGDQDKVFFIFEGGVEILKHSAEGARFSIARLGKGEIVGESALEPVIQSSTVIVRADQPTKALCLPAERFRDLMINSPETAFKVLFDVVRLLRRRLNQVSNKLADSLDENK
jgi:CRP-like cAMP-binding protein